MESLFIGERYFVSNRELRKWLYFEGVSFFEIEEYRVFIFIGSDRSDIIDESFEIRRGVRGQFYVVNIFLGWTVYGLMGEFNSDGVYVNFVRSDYEEMLSMQLECLYNVEFKDIFVDVEESLLFED